MTPKVSYIAINGQTVTLQQLEETISEISYLVHGSILNLKSMPEKEDLGHDQCARLSLALAALNHLKERVEGIFPDPDFN